MIVKARLLFFIIMLYPVGVFGNETELSKEGDVTMLLSPDGNHLAYGIPAYSQDGECVTRIIICRPDGTEQTLVKEVGVREGEVQWLGSNRLLCTEMQSSGYSVVSLDGNTLDTIKLPSGCDVLYKRLSPHGQYAAFVGDMQNSTWGLFIVELKTGRVRCLINKALKTAPAWSPDSRKIAIGNSPGYVREYPLVIVDVETNEIKNVEINGVGASWSRDGRFLAFTTEVVRGGSWYYGIPIYGRIGVLDIATKELSTITPPAHNIYNEETGKEDSEGYLQPAWSPDGNWIAYRKISYFRASKDSEAGQSDETWIANRHSREARKAADGFGPLGWTTDGRYLFVLKETKIDRVDLNDFNTQTLIAWEKPKAPKPAPADKIIIKRPGVIVEAVWIDKAYCTALASVLSEARREYEETFGLSMPRTITLEANREPQGQTKLWTDGESYLFLTIKSKDDLAPPSQSGVYNIFGMCHELGHIAMYRGMRNQVGLPDGVGEGWAVYTGSAVVDTIAERLGQGIWPQPYDVAAVEGSARLRKMIEGREMEELKPIDCAAKVFYELDKKYGRKTVGSAMKTALSGQPSGKELMPLFIEAIKKLTADPNACDWIPERIIVPKTKWEVKQRKVDDSFFADAKTAPDDTGIVLYYGDGKSDGQSSTAGSGHAVLFQKPEGNWFLDRVDVFGSRYGQDEPPNKKFSIYICDEEFNTICEINKHYGLFSKGENQWFKLDIEPVVVPRRFYICLSFEPTYTRGVYVAYDKNVERSHSRSALPYTHVFDVEGKYDWMIRAHLRNKDAK